MDKIRQKAQSLLEKLHDKYGLQSKQHIHLVVATMRNEEGEMSDSLDHWYLVDTSGQKFILPKTMLFLGSEECDVLVQSRSVDKRHAILAYDLYLNRFKVKDLSTTNGTFVNNCRIPEQEYVRLNHMDSIRLGQEAMMYHMEQASKIVQHGGQLPDPLFIPSWASRARDSPTIHILPHPLAEYQGCIAEQNIEQESHLRQHERLNEDNFYLEHHLHQQTSPHTALELLREHHQLPLSRDPSGLPQKFDQVLGQHMDHHSQCGTISSEDQTLLFTDNISDKLWDCPTIDSSTCPGKGTFKHEAHEEFVPKPTVDPENDEATPKNTQTMFFVPLGKDLVCNSSHTIHNGMPPHTSKHGQSPGISSGTSTSSSSPGPVFDKVEAVRSTTYPAGVPNGSTMETLQFKLIKVPTYMEIPLRDDNSPKDVSDSKSSVAASSNVSWSLAKGNLLGSPHQKQPGQSPGPDMNPATSFTIQLADPEHLPTKSLNICSSISQFVPTKIKKSFQGRKTVSSKASKNSEELELTALTQCKVDDTVVGSDGKSRLCGKQVSACTSLRPPNLGEISRLSESSEQWASLETGSDKTGSVKKRPGSRKGHHVLHTPRVTLPSSTKSVPASTAVSMSDYQHPANYLFDKMFEGDSSLPAWTRRENIPEQQQFKGVVCQDNATCCLPTEKALIRPVIDSTIYQGAALKINTTCPTTKLIADNNEDFDNNVLQIIEDIPCEVKEFGEKDEDKFSEAGTYTIEADLNEGQEEEEARKRIGLVFGVDDIGVEHGSLQPVNGYVTVSDLDGCEDMCDDSENTLLDDSSPSPDDDTDYIIDDSDDKISDIVTANGVPTWVSQLTSLANQKSSANNRLAQEDGTASISRKPPQGGSKKRCGTGRKLPSIPTDKTGHTNNLSGRSPDLVSKDAGQVFICDLNGRNSSDNSSKPKSQPQSRSTTNRCPASRDMPAGSRNTGYTMLPVHGPVTISAATSYKSSQTKKVSQLSDADPASTAAFVNRGDDYVTPVLYKSPRDALARRQQKNWSTKSGVATCTLPASLGKKLSAKLISPTTPNPKAVTTPSAGGSKKPSTSDVSSRKDSVDNGSTTSDLSSETGDGILSVSSSKSKATITMTRTNKTFDLRRARAGSLDEPLPLRLTKEPPPVKSTKPSSSKSGVASSAGKSRGMYSSSKSTVVEDTSCCETASLASQVVKKNRSNTSQVTLRKAGSTVLSRTDSGMHSLNQKLKRASSLTITHPVPGGKGDASPKSQLRFTPTSKSNLTIRGISSISSKSHSQPGSRSSSPKAADKMAWKRRKEYDARKSVAIARISKTKDISTSEVTMRLKPADNDNIDRRMIRSASFTNSAGLHNSVSSSQDFVDRRDSYHQHYDLRRAFLPFHNSNNNVRSSYSADEDDSIASATSTQDSAKSLVSLLEIPSAFTPPLLGNKPVSPGSSSPSEASLSLRRRTLNMDRESSSSVMISPHANRDAGDEEQPPQRSVQLPSYDSLIAASVHQLSQKLTRSTDVILNKLREQKQTCLSPSPNDDFINDSGKSEMTAWKTANQELTSTMKNLRMLERHVQIINAVLFPDLDISSEVCQDVPAKQQGKQKLLEDIERKLGFQPIDQPDVGQCEAASPEMVEISGQF